MNEPSAERQQAVVRRALDAGINWFDTAATYGQGESESSLGQAFQQLGLREGVHVATKVRFQPDQLDEIRRHTFDSVRESLQRLGLERLTLLQLHNGITATRDEIPTSITPHDVLGPDGVLEAFEALQSEGLVQHIGLTGTGHPAALRKVVQAGAFATMQIPYHMLNPSAGYPMPESFDNTDYGNLIADCARQSMGILAIRVLAGGALLNRPPSAHTKQTPFFPLGLYLRDKQRAAQLQQQLGTQRNLKFDVIRFVLSHEYVSSALIGFAEPDQINEATNVRVFESLPADILRRILNFAVEQTEPFLENR